MSKLKRKSSIIIWLVIVLLWVSEMKTSARVVVAPAPAPAPGNDNSSIESIWHTKHVYAYNSFSESNTFGIYCKSGDDDLGYHEVRPGEYYMFHFKPSIFHTTLYFCTLNWNNYNISFDIYRYNRDSNRCDHDCNWNVRMDAVVGYMEGFDYPDITIPWDRHPQL